MRKSILSILVLLFVVSVNAQSKKWTLQECVTYALDNNISIKQQELNLDLIKEDITSAQGNFYPSLNATANHSYNFGSFIDINGGRVSLDTRSNSFGISTGVILFNGFRNKNNLLQARKSLEAAGFDLEENKNSVMLFVVNAYLNALLNKENIKIASNQVEISQNQVDQAQKLVDAGVEPIATLLEAKATLATNLEQLTVANNNLDLALLSLAQLLQLPKQGFDVSDVELNIDSASLIYNDTQDIFNKAVTSLPEIKSAEIAVENSEVAVDLAKGAFYPTLSFGAGANTGYQHVQGQEDLRLEIDPDTQVATYVPNGFGRQLEDNLGYNVGFSLNIPIFNRFQTKANVNRAKINQERASLQLLDRKIQLRESIERAYTDARASLNQYISAESSLKAQQESFKNAQESYNTGVMNSYDFEQVRNRLVNAQASMVNAKYNFVFRTKLLEFYYGIPLSID